MTTPATPTQVTLTLAPRQRIVFLIAVALAIAGVLIFVMHVIANGAAADPHACWVNSVGSRVCP